MYDPDGVGKSYTYKIQQTYDPDGVISALPFLQNSAKNLNHINIFNFLGL
jgi:hypothetical protein